VRARPDSPGLVDIRVRCDERRGLLGIPPDDDWRETGPAY